MKRVLIFLLAPGAMAQTTLHLQTGASDGQMAALAGRDATLQLVATAKRPDGREIDVTRSVQWDVQPPSVAVLSATGQATPLADGVATVTATTDDGAVASTQIQVTGAEAWRRANFTHDIIPVLTKYGCNGGGCHGKSEGQNGFKLSLLGFEPAEDYEHLVHEARGRRLFPAAPENSLLLL